MLILGAGRILILHLTSAYIFSLLDNVDVMQHLPVTLKASNLPLSSLFQPNHFIVPNPVHSLSL